MCLWGEISVKYKIFYQNSKKMSQIFAYLNNFLYLCAEKHHFICQ